MNEEELLKLREEVKKCKKCDLWKTRNKPVFGEGPFDAKIICIGLGPGSQEDKQGRPFVGAAGKFLNELLRLANLKREEIFITNVIKCYLPENKATEEQIKACTPYLDKQIRLISPKIIVTLGQVATSYIFQKFGINLKPMQKIHGKSFDVQNLLQKIKIFVMYHPATALYNPKMREILKEDWRTFGKKVKGLLE